MKATLWIVLAGCVLAGVLAASGSGSVPPVGPVQTTIQATMLGADLVDPETVRFCNEQVRPMAEKLRAISAELQAMLDTYNVSGGIGAKVYAAVQANPADLVEDGRASEGVSRLTVNDVYGFMIAAQTLETALDNAATTINKPCVRALSAN